MPDELPLNLQPRGGQDPLEGLVQRARMSRFSRRAGVAALLLAGAAGSSWLIYDALSDRTQQAQQTPAARPATPRPAPPRQAQPQVEFEPLTVQLGPGYWAENAIMDKYFGSRDIGNILTRVSQLNNNISPTAPLKKGTKIKLELHYGRGPKVQEYEAKRDNDTPFSVVQRAIRGKLNKDGYKNALNRKDKRYLADKVGVVSRQYAEQHGLKVVPNGYLKGGLAVVVMQDGATVDTPGDGQFTLFDYMVPKKKQPAASSTQKAPAKPSTQAKTGRTSAANDAISIDRKVAGANINALGSTIEDPVLRAAYLRTQQLYA